MKTAGMTVIKLPGRKERRQHIKQRFAGILQPCLQSTPFHTTLLITLCADMGWSVLKTTLGKFLQIQECDSTLTLCIEEVQNEDENAPQVYIYTDEDHQEAFKFRHEGCCYWVKAVKADAWKLEIVKDDDTNSKPFWFKRVDEHSSEQYGLCFTTETTIFYLSEKNDNGREFVTITDDRLKSLIVTQEKREES